MVNEGAILFGVDVGGVSFSADGVEFVEEVADVGVGSGGYGGGIVGEWWEVFVLSVWMYVTMICWTIYLNAMQFTFF